MIQRCCRRVAVILLIQILENQPISALSNRGIDRWLQKSSLKGQWMEPNIEWVAASPHERNPRQKEFHCNLFHSLLRANHNSYLALRYSAHRLHAVRVHAPTFDP